MKYPERFGVYSSSSSSSSAPAAPWEQCQRLNVKVAHIPAWKTYTSVCGLFLFVSFFVGSSLGLKRSALLLAESLPFLAEKFTNFACDSHVVSRSAHVGRNFTITHTKLNTWVLVANLLSLLIGEKHISRKTALGGSGI